MNFKEVQRLLKMMNIDMNEDHALRLFQVGTAPEGLEGLERGWRGWNKWHSTSLQKNVFTFFCPSIHPFICSPNYLFTQTNIDLFIYLSTQPAKAASCSSLPFICPSSCLSVHPANHPSVYLSINPISQ